MVVLDGATRTAVAAATSQQAQCEALVAAWAGGNVTARVFAGTTLLRTLTIAPFAISGTGTRVITCGATIADTAVATGSPTSVVFRSGSTDIFRVDAGVGGASINFVGDIRTLCPPSLAGVVFTATATLPVYGTPTWLSGASTFDWIQIPGSTLAGSAAGIGSTPGDATAPTTKLLAYSGISKRGTEVWTIATGGHNDSSDNGVRKLELAASSPAWELIKASDWNGTEANIAYYASGSPASRHAHRSTFWVPQRSRFLLINARAVAGGAANSFTDTASFNPSTPGWDAQGTRATPLCSINAFDPVTGIGLGSYSSSGGQIVRFDAAADSYTVTAGGSIGYMPTGAYDSNRGEFYYMGWGDGENAGASITSRKVSFDGATVTPITLTGAGATAFAAATPLYGTMVFDPVVDCYWWWDGFSRQLFKIVPNGTTTWTCTVQTITSTPPVVAQYSFSRMEYITELGGLVFMPTGAHPMFFVKTS